MFQVQHNTDNKTTKHVHLQNNTILQYSMSKKSLVGTQKRTQAYLQGNEIKKERRKWTMKEKIFNTFM